MLLSAVDCAAVGLVSWSSTADVQGQDQNTDFAAKFWSWLQKADYEQWAPMTGQTADFYKGRKPHGAFLKVFANRTTFSDPKDPPPGSIIIKHNYDAEKKLAAITVMYRVKDYDNKHHDWWWVKYKPNGEVFKKGDKSLSGKVKGCIDCHSAAQGGDYVFTNDEN